MDEYVISFAVADDGDTKHDLGYSIIGHAGVVDSLKDADSFVRYPPSDIAKMIRTDVLLIAQEDKEYGRVVCFGVFRDLPEPTYLSCHKRAAFENGRLKNILEINFNRYTSLISLDRYISGSNPYDEYVSCLHMVDIRTLRSAYLSVMKLQANARFHTTLKTISDYLAGNASDDQLVDAREEMASFPPRDRLWEESTKVVKMIDLVLTGKGRKVIAHDTLIGKSNFSETIRQYIFLPDVMLPIMISDILAGQEV